MFRTKKREISLQIFERKCIGCESCVDRCRHRVLGMVYDGKRDYATVEYPNRCTGCGKCVQSCFSNAIELKVK